MAAEKMRVAMQENQKNANQFPGSLGDPYRQAVKAQQWGINKYNSCTGNPCIATGKSSSSQSNQQNISTSPTSTNNNAESLNKLSEGLQSLANRSKDNFNEHAEEFEEKFNILQNGSSIEEKVRLNVKERDAMMTRFLSDQDGYMKDFISDLEEQEKLEKEVYASVDRKLHEMDLRLDSIRRLMPETDAIVNDDGSISLFPRNANQYTSPRHAPISDKELIAKFQNDLGQMVESFFNNKEYTTILGQEIPKEIEFGGDEDSEELANISENQNDNIGEDRGSQQNPAIIESSIGQDRIAETRSDIKSKDVSDEDESSNSSSAKFEISDNKAKELEDIAYSAGDWALKKSNPRLYQQTTEKIEKTNDALKPIIITQRTLSDFNSTFKGQEGHDYYKGTRAIATTGTHDKEIREKVENVGATVQGAVNRLNGQTVDEYEEVLRRKEEGTDEILLPRPIKNIKQKYDNVISTTEDVLKKMKSAANTTGVKEFWPVDMLFRTSNRWK
ncbi:MAG: hypothetical protein HY960_08120 [Ignavibacteriae bacterium]|nr:hypothetical protein [Ignavibacteriota bacterium]